MSNKRFGEENSVANCKHTILQISLHLVIWPFGERSLNPSWPNPILRTIRAEQKLGIWQPVRSSWKVWKLSVYQLINKQYVFKWFFNRYLNPWHFLLIEQFGVSYYIAIKNKHWHAMGVVPFLMLFIPGGVNATLI